MECIHYYSSYILYVHNVLVFALFLKGKDNNNGWTPLDCAFNLAIKKRIIWDKIDLPKKCEEDKYFYYLFLLYQLSCTKAISVTQCLKKSVKWFCSVMSIFSAAAAALIVAPNQSCGSFIKKLDYDLWSHLVKILTIMHHLAISTRQQHQRH